MVRKRCVSVIVLVAVLMLFLYQPTAYGQQAVRVKVAGKTIETDPAPFIDNNRVMVPAREIANILGANVNWDGQNQAVKIEKGNKQIAMTIGNAQAVVNGEEVQLEALPVIVKGRAMVPLRILAEGLQVPLSWDSIAHMVSLDVLVAGSSVDFPPFEFVENNEYVGFEIDLIHAIEEVLGERIVIKDIRFNQLIPSLSSGEIDLVISGLTIFEQRKEVVDFTIPYYNYGEVILSAKGSNKDVTLADLAGKKIACQSGSRAQEIVGGLINKYPNTLMAALATTEEIFSAVEQGIVDAAIVPHAPTAYYLTRHGGANLMVVGEVPDSQPMGIAVQKGNQELLDKLNHSLETIMENGTYDLIYEKWFGPKI